MQCCLMIKFLFRLSLRRSQALFGILLNDMVLIVVRSFERNELLKTVKHSGRTIWKEWSGHHCRSWMETKMYCIKLLGDKLSVRNF